MHKLTLVWSRLQSSFWFLPSVIVALSIALAIFLIDVDSGGTQRWMADWPRLFGAGAAGARQMLSTIAGSMMTVVGVTFSMTLMTLVLASSQYTSRILRNFMRDRITQAVLGIFAGIFTYCLIVLRTIRGGDDSAFIPSLAVLCGVVLAIGGISVLIYFIHHIASSIQASSIVASVAEETMTVIDRLFPQNLGKEPVADDVPLPRLSGRHWHSVRAAQSGYIQSVDSAALLRIAKEHATVVRMERGIGEFTTHDTVLVSIALADSPPSEILEALQAAYTIDRHRTVEQDAAFGIRQIVDIALRALSPSINDTTTAVVCVDYLSAVLSHVANRAIPSPYRFADGELRVIVVEPTFADLVDKSFDQIRDNAKNNLAVQLRLLDALHAIADQTDNRERRAVLRDHVGWIVDSTAGVFPERDRTQLEISASGVRESLARDPFDCEARSQIPMHRPQL